MPLCQQQVYEGAEVKAVNQLGQYLQSSHYIIVPQRAAAAVSCSDALEHHLKTHMAGLLIINKENAGRTYLLVAGVLQLVLFDAAAACIPSALATTWRLWELPQPAPAAALLVLLPLLLRLYCSCCRCSCCR